MSTNRARRGIFGRGRLAYLPGAVLAGLALATWFVAGCSARADLGGTGDRDAGSPGAGSGTGGGSPRGNGGAAGASGGGAPSGAAGTGGMAGGGVTVDGSVTGGETGSGGKSSGGVSGSAGASGGTVNDGGAPPGDGSSSGGAPAGSGATPSSGGAPPDAGALSGSTGGTGGTSGAGGTSTTHPTTCSSGVKDGDETDVDCGGSCGPCGPGQACGYNWDCSATAAGCDTALGGCACDEISHLCVASHCVDRRRDGAESDVDCGGQCAGCGPAEVCYHDADCSVNASGCDHCACDRNTSTCVHDHCSDNKLDADETALDCGGARCTGCTPGVACKVDSDCASKACDAISHTCASYHCSDHHLDGDETDVDCGGPYCNSCLSGFKCVTSLDCQSGHPCNTSKVCQ